MKLKPLDQWRKKLHTLDDLIAEMAKNLQEVPGVEYNFSQPIRDNVAENISGQFGQVALEIYGDDLAQLQAASERATAIIEAMPGAADVGVVKSGETPQIAVRLDRSALARFNLDLGEVQDYIETAMGGHVASEIWDGERRYAGVRMNVRNRDLGSFVQEAQAKVSAQVSLPSGYEMAWGGEFENQQRALHRLKLVRAEA